MSTPLTIAAERGHDEMLKLLLQYGAQINGYTIYGITALHRAVHNNHESCINLLLSHDADCNAADATGATPINYAAEQIGYSNLSLLLKHCKEPKLNHTSGDNTNPLKFAVEPNDQEKVKLLLEYNADPNIKDKSRRTPLHFACFHGYVQIAEILILAGANPNYKDSYAISPLINAINQCNENCVSLLISHDANVNLGVNYKFDRKIAIMHAAKTNNLNIIKLLVEAGCNLNKPGHCGETSLHIAAKHGGEATIEYLLIHGANPNMTDDNGLTALFHVIKQASQRNNRMAKTLIQHNACLEKRGRGEFVSQNNRTPVSVLEVSLRVENAIAIQMLITAGCSLRKLQKQCMRDILPDPLKNKHPEVYDFLMEAVKSPPQLKQMCRVAIREILGVGIMNKVVGLPIPNSQQDFLMLKDLDNLFE